MRHGARRRLRHACHALLRRLARAWRLVGRGAQPFANRRCTVRRSRPRRLARAVKFSEVGIGVGKAVDSSVAIDVVPSRWWLGLSCGDQPLGWPLFSGSFRKPDVRVGGMERGRRRCHHFCTEFGSMAWDRAAREAATEADFVGKIGLVTTGRHATERRLPNSYPYRASTTGRPCVA